MSSKIKDKRQVALKQLWGQFMPPLTPEQQELSIQLWQKIKSRKPQQHICQQTLEQK